MSRKSVAAALLSSVGGALIGGAVTYFIIKKDYEQYAEEEIEKIRRHYTLIRKGENLVTYGEAIKERSEPVEQPAVEPELPFTPTQEQIDKAQGFIEKLGYNTVPTVPIAESRSIFEMTASPEEVGPELDGPNGKPIEVEDTDPNDPMAGYVRYSGQPYIISMEEYFESEEAWDKDTLSYYEGDDTLVDERDKTVEDVEKYIGSRHLHMFGVLSNDKNIVYVRNPNINTDFEIILERGKAAVRVYGQEDPDVEKRPIRRMRDSD